MRDAAGRIPRRGWPAAIGLAVLLGVRAAGAELEPSPVLRASEFLPPHLLRSAHHRVSEEVGLAENLMRFEVESDFGIYAVASESLLRVRVHEIGVLAEAISQYERADRELAATLRGQLRLNADSVVDILSSPLSSATDLAGQLSTNIYDTFSGEGRRAGPSARPGPPAAAGAADSIFEAHKRAVAHQLGLDPYSTNPRVQEFLGTVAAARASGTFSAGSGVVLRPRPHPGRSLKQLELEVRSLVRQLDESELLEAVSGELRLKGLPWTDVQTFVSNPWLSASRKMTITAYLDRLAGVENLGAIVAEAARSRSEEEAITHEQFVRMMAVYHQEEPLARVLPVPAGAQTRRGSVAIILPVDLIYWGEETRAMLERVRREPAVAAARSLDLLVLGRVTEQTRRELGEAGLSVQERFLHGD